MTILVGFYTVSSGEICLNRYGVHVGVYISNHLRTPNPIPSGSESGTLSVAMAAMGLLFWTWSYVLVSSL